MVCVAPYTSPGVGANNQAGGGCFGNTNSLGLTNGNYYYAEIYSDNNCAQGSAGCIYGCNGNRDFAINGTLIAHFADCGSADGVNGISGGVLEPGDANGATPKDSTNLYTSYSYLGYIEAIIFGSYYTSNSLSQYCGAPPIDPPPGAGSIVYSATEATLATYGGTCGPGGQTPTRATAPVRPGAPPQPQAPTGGRTTTGLLPKPVAGPIATAVVQPKLTYNPARGNLPHYLASLSNLKNSVPVVLIGSPSPTPTPRPGPP